MEQKEILSSTLVRGPVLVSLFLLVSFYTAVNFLIIKAVFKPGYQEMEKELALGQLSRIEELIAKKVQALADSLENYPLENKIKEYQTVDGKVTPFLHLVMNKGEFDSAQILQVNLPGDQGRSGDFFREIFSEDAKFLYCSENERVSRSGLVMQDSNLLAVAMRCISLGSQGGSMVAVVATKGLNDEINSFSRQFNLKAIAVSPPFDGEAGTGWLELADDLKMHDSTGYLKLRKAIPGSPGRYQPHLEVSLEKRFSHRGGVILDYIMVSSISGGTLLMVLFLVLYRHEVTRVNNYFQRSLNRRLDNFNRQIRTETESADKVDSLREDEQRQMVLQAKTIRDYQEKIIRERTAVLKETNSKLVNEIKERLRIEQHLQEIQNKLEETVQTRTLELVRANTFLRDEIEDRKNREQELKKYQQQLRYLSSSLLNIEERERRQLAVDLHDRIGQSLSVAKMYVDSLLETCSDSGNGGEQKMLKVQDLLQQTIRDTRTLTFELSPPILYELGLEAALEWLAERLLLQYELKVEVQCDISNQQMSASFLALIFRSIRELLMNVVRHAKASSAVITVYLRDGVLHIEVSDDGIGIDRTDMSSDKNSGGFGLFSIRERLINIGGRVDISSSPVRGAKVALLVPVESFSAE
ncbi:MAG: histidine kinase [Desulfobulbaceae bacterium]|nr:histidine kinase [Desulfobulbaceae bacterium]